MGGFGWRIDEVRNRGTLIYSFFLCSSPTNNSMVYFPYRSPYRSPFVLRSFSVHSPFVLRSFSVHSPFVLRSGIGDRSENERRFIGGKTEMYRNSNGKSRERRPEQKLYFQSLKFKLLWQDLLLTSSLFCAITSRVLKINEFR